MSCLFVVLSYLEFVLFGLVLVLSCLLCLCLCLRLRRLSLSLSCNPMQKGVFWSLSFLVWAIFLPLRPFHTEYTHTVCSDCNELKKETYPTQDETIMTLGASQGLVLSFCCVVLS